MPTYLCHGFRWKRRSIRVYVVVQNLDDAAPEWVVKRGSPQSLIESFYSLFNFLPQCTFPPTPRSSLAPHSYSNSLSHRGSVVGGGGGDNDHDDAASHYTTRSATGRSSSRSRTLVAQKSQPQFQYHQQERDLETPTGPTSFRESSNSSRRRSKSELSRKPVPLTTHATHVYQTHQAPPSPPSSQPYLPCSSDLSEGAAADPVMAQDWSPVKVLEEHDPNNLDEVSRPYAYVADYVQRIDSSCSIVQEIARYEQMVRASRFPAVSGPSSDETLNPKRDTARLGGLAGWFEQLRDQLQRGEEIRWYVVVNGDEEREWPADGGASRPDTRAHMAHPTQHAHISEGRDRDLEMRREQLRRDLGYEQGGIDMLVDRRMERRPPIVPSNLLSPLQMDVPMHPAGPARPKTPKISGKGGFRRLFGKSKSGEQTP